MRLADRPAPAGGEHDVVPCVECGASIRPVGGFGDTWSAVAVGGYVFVPDAAVWFHDGGEETCHSQDDGDWPTTFARPCVVVTRGVRITNVYFNDDARSAGDATEIITTTTVDLPNRPLTQDDIDTLIYPLTGTDATGNLHAAYFVRSTDGLDPVLAFEFF